MKTSIGYRHRFLKVRQVTTLSLVLLVVFGIAVVIGACHNTPEIKVPTTSTPAANQTIRIGVGPWIGFGPLYLAKEKGFFDETGTKVELTVLTGVSERNSALKANRIDGLAAPVDYFVLSAGNGIPMSIAMAIDESVGGDGIVAKASIKTIGDLKGKHVAFQRGLPSEFFLRALLQRNHLNIGDLNTVDMETADAGAAFLAGRLDAATVWEPWLSKAKEGGKGHILASTREYPNLILDCIAFTPDMVRRNPKAVQHVVNAVLKAIEYWKEHPDEADKIMAPHFDVPPKKYAAILSGARFCDLQRNQALYGDKAKLGAIFQVGSQASDIWVAAKAIPNGVKPDTVIVPQFILGAK